MEWPQYITDKLVFSDDPSGTISNSNLKPAGGLLHLEALVQCFNIRERTVLSKTDNLSALFWSRNGSTLSNKVPPHLLRLFGIHQQYHCYVPQHNYISGKLNHVADTLSRDFFLSWNELLNFLSPVLPMQPTSCQIWTPSLLVSLSVISLLLKKRLRLKSVLAKLKATRQVGDNRKSSVLNWASTPF